MHTVWKFEKMLLRFYVKSIFDFYLFDLKALKIANQDARKTISRKNEQKKETYFTHSASKALVNSLSFGCFGFITIFINFT